MIATGHLAKMLAYRYIHYMEEKELSELLSEFADILAEVAYGRSSIAMLDRINEHIRTLNVAIDEIYHEEKLETEYDMVDLCYQFYRLRDKAMEIHL